jgi:hypothetical protein
MANLFLKSKWQESSFLFIVFFGFRDKPLMNQLRRPYSAPPPPTATTTAAAATTTTAVLFVVLFSSSFLIY